MDLTNLIVDTRGKVIEVNDEVVYLPEPRLTYQKVSLGSYTVTVTGLKASKVTAIVRHPMTGFCEMGDQIDVHLEDGTLLTGDSENGGWGCLKLG